MRYDGMWRTFHVQQTFIWLFRGAHNSCDSIVFTSIARISTAAHGESVFQRISHGLILKSLPSVQLNTYTTIFYYNVNVRPEIMQKRKSQLD